MRARTIRRADSSRRWVSYLSVVGLGVWLSGALWLIFHHFLVRQGEFGPQVHPLEPWCLRVHGAMAFASIWLFGLIWSEHVARRWPSSRRKWSGGFLSGIFVLLTVTGYLLYYVGDDRARAVVSILHWGIGLAGPVFFALHRVELRRGRLKTASLASEDVASSGAA